MSISKYEISLTPNYVSNWGFKEAIRELIQNGADQETIDEKNSFTIEYNEKTQELHLCNKNSYLEHKTLLLGATSKANNTSTLGQFGEGYKMATLVLLRENHPITIFNYGKNEIWKPKFIQSTRYQETVLAFFIDNNNKLCNTSKNNLEFVISNITLEDWQQTKETYLNLQQLQLKCSTQYGDILLDSTQKGKIYAGGLVVTDKSNYHYGYNLKNAYIKLGRDRELIDSWDMSYTIANMWNEIANENELDDIWKETLTSLIKAQAPDISHFKYITVGADTKATFIKQFKQQHNEKCVPVNTALQQYKCKQKGLTPIVVSEQEANILSEFTNEILSNTEDIVQSTIKTKFLDWFYKYGEYVGSIAKKEFMNLVEELTEEE